MSDKFRNYKLIGLFGTKIRIIKNCKKGGVTYNQSFPIDEFQITQIKRKALYIIKDMNALNYECNKNIIKYENRIHTYKLLLEFKKKG